MFFFATAFHTTAFFHEGSFSAWRFVATLELIFLRMWKIEELAVCSFFFLSCLDDYDVTVLRGEVFSVLFSPKDFQGVERGS